jgi:BASS family bile acid:Na+ symporter
MKQTLLQIIPLAFTISLAGLVASFGMDATLDDLMSLFRRPMRLLKAVLAVNMIVPAAAVVICAVLPETQVVRAGLLVMAVSPVPPLVPGKALRTGASKSYTYGLFAALALLSVVIVPVSVAILAPLYGAVIPLGPFAVAKNVGLSVVLPLAAGLAIRNFMPASARRLGPLMAKISMVLLLAAFLPILVLAWPAMVAMANNGAYLAMALLAAVALLAGHLLGGPERSARVALATAAATRHPGIALMIAGTATDDKRITAAIVAVMLTALVVSIPYQIWLKRSSPAAG